MLNEIGSFISQYGFPIVACCALFYQNNLQSQRHAEESEKWAQALSANTAAINSLQDTLGRFNENDK